MPAAPFTLDQGGRVFVPPSEIATHLGVSGSTLRRISADYEATFGELPRDEQRRRLWPVEAAQRVSQAHQAVREGLATSTRAALQVLKEEGDFLLPLDAPAPPGAGRALDHLDELATQVQRQGEGITTLLRGLDERDAEIASALRLLAEAQRAQTEELQQLRTEIRACRVPAPPSAPPSSLFLQLLRTIFKRP